MTYRGRVQNGVVILHPPADLPDGAEVEVRLVEQAADVPAGRQGPTLYERLKGVVGKAKGLPPDAALNHDHYLYGLPRK
jgi:hypothetical protein